MKCPYQDKRGNCWYSEHTGLRCTYLLKFSKCEYIKERILRRQKQEVTERVRINLRGFKE